MTSSRHRTGTIAAVALLTLLAGCSSNSDSPEPEETTPPSPSATPETDAAEENVLAAYRGYWDARIAMHAEPTVHSSELSSFANAAAFEEAREAALYYIETGTRMTGEPALHPEVTALEADADPPTAEITDCVDSTDYLQVNADGEPLEASDEGRQHLVVSTLVETESGWRVETSTVDREQTC